MWSFEAEDSQFHLKILAELLLQWMDFVFELGMSLFSISNCSVIVFNTEFWLLISKYFFSIILLLGLLSQLNVLVFFYTSGMTVLILSHVFKVFSLFWRPSQKIIDVNPTTVNEFKSFFAELSHFIELVSILFTTKIIQISKPSYTTYILLVQMALNVKYIEILLPIEKLNKRAKM